MKTTGTTIKLGIVWLVLSVFTVMIIVVFGQVRFHHTTGYSAVFTHVSGLRAGQFVRAAGVEVGKVAKVTLIDGDKQVLVDFTVDRSLSLDQATTASIRYLNLIGDRYLELGRGHSGQRLAPGATIPLEHTHPALDLDALLGGFRPLFQTLDPDKVNSIASSIITVFQGQGATINDILDQTASLTATLADRDHAIGEVVNNLNTVLATTVKHQTEFDRTSVPMLFATPTYYAQFADTGGINTGDKVEIAGVNVGLVRSLAIRGNRVLIGFSLPGKTIGMQSRAAIRTDTILGRKNLEIEPRGSEPLKPNGFLPLAQTTTPYQIYDAFVDVTKAATGWDIDAVKRSLNVLSETFDQTAPHLSAALEGVKAFSDTVGRRGEQIEQLLANANRIARVLGDRSEQVNGLLVNAKTLLAAFKQRSQALRILLTNVSEASAQVSGLITDNPNLNHVLAQLRTVSEELVKRKNELADVAVLLGRYTAALTEAVGSGPFFKAMVVNLLPYQILQPWVDAAFKKRGIDPENFWRSAGLPEFRWPDPNGTRFPNGAPPAAPPVREGTPKHPGPAVPPGTPCSYTPAAGALPRPDTPLPCAGATVGPFGGPDFPAPLDVQPSPPNPDGPPPTPGILSAGRPGEPAPAVPGIPMPLPPNAPPGARTQPLEPFPDGTGGSNQ
ncbi:MCE-family protein Mce2C [Mycobacterium tuberculosis UT0038]|nr:MCE-family protein Mce2C [Mycobacterium tuberculosis UT0038]